MPKHKSYSEKLRDPRWQKRRLEILSKAEFSCLMCDATDKPLHVHHVLYDKGKEPWEYDDELLLSLCEDCHYAHAHTQRSILRLLAEFPPDFLDDLYGALIDILTSPEHCFIAWGKWIKAAHWQPKQKKP